MNLFRKPKKLVPRTIKMNPKIYEMEILRKYEDLKTSSTADEDDHGLSDPIDSATDSSISCGLLLKHVIPQKSRNRSFLLKKKTEVSFFPLIDEILKFRIVMQDIRYRPRLQVRRQVLFRSWKQ